MIIEHVWNLNFDPTTNVVDVYITYLRRKVPSVRCRWIECCGAWSETLPRWLRCEGSVWI